MSTTHFQSEPETDASVAGDAPPAGSHAQDDVKRAKLMIMDDDPVNIKAVEKHLRAIGYEQLVTTSDSSRAFELISQEQPDLVLLDMMLPQVNGLDLLRQARNDARWRNLPMIVLTAYCGASAKREALEAGATDFLAKPVDPHELALRVRNVLVAKAYYHHLEKRADQLDAQVRRQTEELGAARHEAELRYMVGKAEIATDVLHNVGNALHSVNTSVNLVAYTVRQSKLESLKRAIDLLQQHEGNLPKFLTKDERGKVLPSYLIELTESLLAEREKIFGEIEMLTKHLEHINVVVATQQKYAALCNVTEEVPLAELLGDVEELVGGSFARHGIEVARDFQDTPPINTDRQKLLQVLLNVVKNAVDAITQIHKPGDGRLMLRFGSHDGQRAFIEVSDNGAGILSENLIKIFAHGFTTKKDGHGFGLHSCANIMNELGGTFQAHSDGLGCGTTFVAELPIERESEKA